MKIFTNKIEFHSKGNNDIIDITGEVERFLHSSGLKDGNATCFVVGSTLGITTIEYEPGLIKDFPELLEKLIPSKIRYHHDDTWGDGNGHSHLRASLIGSSLVIPFSNNQLLLGTWQQIVCIDFDNRPRNRTCIIQFIGE